MTTTVDHELAILGAALEAAWLQHRGPDNRDREFRLAGEFIPVLDGFSAEIEVSLYPAYGHRRDGKVRSWSLHRPIEGQEYVECWQWSIGTGWDDLKEDDPRIDQVEDLGGCWDDHCVTFMVEGSHQRRPPLPHEVGEAFTLLQPGQPEQRRAAR